LEDNPVRRALDTIYLGSAYLGGFSTVVLAAIVLAQIAGRLLNFVVPSVTQISGYLMCATIFLALAHTLAEGAHIRVDLFIGRLEKNARWRAELAILLASVLITSYFTVFVVDLTWESFVTGERSDGLLGVPYVIPQGAMTIGLLIFLVRLIEEIVILVQTGRPAHLKSGEEKTVDQLLREDNGSRP
jgi:TRAP-type C4-dicarboxylate transport system permease small subunit